MWASGCRLSVAQPPVLLQLGQVSAVKPVFSGQASSETCATAVYIVGPAGGRLIKTGCIVHIQTTSHYDHIPLGCWAREFVRGFPYLLAPPHPTNGNGMEQFFLEKQPEDQEPAQLVPPYDTSKRCLRVRSAVLLLVVSLHLFIHSCATPFAFLLTAC